MSEPYRLTAGNMTDPDLPRGVLVLGRRRAREGGAIPLSVRRETCLRDEPAAHHHVPRGWRACEPRRVVRLHREERPAAELVPLHRPPTALRRCTAIRSVRGRPVSNRDPEATYNAPAQSIPFAIAEWVRQNLRVHLPGLVRAYDARTMRARVQPALRALVSQPDGSTEPMDRAPIYDVPVQWPGSGGFVFHCDLQPGDPVWLKFSERGIGEFKRTLELADPPPMVMFETRDAVAYPYRAEEIVPVEGTTAGDIRDVTRRPAGRSPAWWARRCRRRMVIRTSTWSPTRSDSGSATRRSKSCRPA